MKPQKFTTALISTLLILSSLTVMAQSDLTKPVPADTGAVTNQKSADSDKLDLKKLDDKYWSEKDTDFTVIQNRTYDKANRFYLTASYGVLVNDAYSTGRMENLSAGYYFNERWGVELSYETGTLSPNDAVNFFKQYQGVAADYNTLQNYTSANVLWVPFYSKTSFLDRAIVYFDIQFAAGVGYLNYQNQIVDSQGGPVGRNTMGYNFDFTQQLFFSKHWALRLDLKNTWSSQDKVHANYTSSQGSSRDIGSTTEQDTSFLLGITYFFGHGNH